MSHSNGHLNRQAALCNVGKYKIDTYEKLRYIFIYDLYMNRRFIYVDVDIIDDLYMNRLIKKVINFWLVRFSLNPQPKPSDVLYVLVSVLLSVWDDLFYRV